MRPTQSISLLVTVITATLVVVLVSIFAWQAVRALEGQREAVRIRTQAMIARDILSAREAFRAELGVLDTITAVETPASAEMLERLKARHAQAVAVLRRLEPEIKENPVPDEPGYIAAILASHARHDALLEKVLAVAKAAQAQRPPVSEFDPKRSLLMVVAALDEQSLVISRNIARSGSSMGELMKVSDLIWFVRSFAGTERRRTAVLMAKNRRPSREELDLLAHTRGAVDAPWQFITMSMRQKDFPPALRQAIKRAEKLYFVEYRALQKKMIGDLEAGKPVTTSGLQWLEMTNPRLDSLLEVARTALDVTGAQARARESAATKELVNALVLMLASIGLAMLGAVHVIWQVVRPLRQITQAINAASAGERRVIGFDGRADEIGQFSRALNLFQRNMAEKKALEMEVLRKNVEMEAAVTASRVKSEFLANMSHELRTPLNAVIGFSDMMLHKAFGPLSEKYEEYARLINESGSHLLNLVSDILDLAKIEAGKMVLDIRQTDLSGVVDSCLQLSAGMAEGRQVKLVKEVPDAPVLIDADARACKQILLNLLSNAVKFSSSGGCVKVSLEVKPDFVRMRVRDKGIGIPADVLPRLGGAFEQAANDPHLAREGTGLGLALVRRLAAAHGGSVHLASTENVGTCVTVELPLRCAERQAA